MKASKATVRQRVDDILRVILDGAEPWQIGPYVAEQEQASAAPWTVPDGGKPLSRWQIRRYIGWAERLMAASSRTDRAKLLRKHEAQRRNLFARAVNKGDERTALAVLRDLAELQGLYGDELTRQLEELRQRVEKLLGANDGNGNDAGAAAVPRPHGGQAGGGA